MYLMSWRPGPGSKAMQSPAAFAKHIQRRRVAAIISHARGESVYASEGHDEAIIVCMMPLMVVSLLICRCGGEWCWICGEPYMKGHFRYGTCEQFGEDYFEEMGMSREEYYLRFMPLNHW